MIEIMLVLRWPDRSLTGSVAVKRNSRKGCDGLSGPRPKDRRRSLNNASQEKKMAAMVRRWMKEKAAGRIGKRKITGIRAVKRRKPGGMRNEVKRT